MMALSGEERASRWQVALKVSARSPSILSSSRTAAGVLAAWLQFQPPVAVDRLLQYLAQAAAPCALFAMGVTLALRPLKRVPRELGLIAALKTRDPPAHLLPRAERDRAISGCLGLYGGDDGRAAYRNERLRHRPAIIGVWVERASASILLTTIIPPSSR